MGGCRHARREQEGMIHEKGPHGKLVTVRSYRCLDCDAVWTDRSTPEKKVALNVSGTQTGRFKDQGMKPAPKVGEAQTGKGDGTPLAEKEKKEAMANEKKETQKRTENALSDGRWEVGKTYSQDFTPRKGKNAGKKCTCKMTVLKSGFKDQDGHVWPTPTALTTNFAIKVLGQSEKTRRPASAFFGIDVPKGKKVQTRSPAKEKTAKKAPAKKAAPKPAPKKAAAKPAEKPAEAPKLAPPPPLNI